MKIKLFQLKTLFVSSALMMLIGMFNYSCTHDTEGLDKIPEVSFSKDVLPIFEANCAKSGCHDASAAGGKILADYDKIMQGGIKPYDSQNSHVYKVLHKAWGNIMPPDAPLTMEQRILIRLWIDQGAQNN